MKRRSVLHAGTVLALGGVSACGGTDAGAPAAGAGDEEAGPDVFPLPLQVALDVAPYASWGQAMDDLDGGLIAGDERRTARTLAFAAKEWIDHLQQVGLRVVQTGYRGVASVPSVHLSIRRQFQAPGVDYGVLGQQGYALVPDGGHIHVAANTGIGALYGIYRLLGLLGFAWHDPDETLLPDARFIVSARRWSRVAEVPRADMRGFWVYDTNPIPDEFALWLARNRLNLCAPARPALASRLGLIGWSGHHDLLQQEFSTPGLFEAHPDWYSVIGGVRRPVAATGSYINPAFGSTDAADYFAQRLVQRLEHGDLRQVDLLNVWPADDRFRPFDDSDRARSIGNPTDNLLVFYARVAQRLREAHEHGTLSRPVTLAGISYFQTMEAPTSSPVVRSLAAERYVHLFYPIERSWGGPLGEKGAGRSVNERFLRAAAAWQAATPFSFGVVDYHNVSTFGGVALTGHQNLLGDLDTCVGIGGAVFAYMHPLLRNPGPRRLTNQLLSELLWQAAPGAPPDPPPTRSEVAMQAYFSRRFGDAGTAWRTVYDMLARSVSGATEMFGINSLHWLLHQDLIWTPGFYRPAEVQFLIPRFTQGGAQRLPAAYSGMVDFEARFIGLDAALDLLHQAESVWEAELARPRKEPERARLLADALWFRATISRYRLLMAGVERDRASALGADTSAIRARMDREIEYLANSPTTLDTVSPVDQRHFLSVHRQRARTP